MRRRPKGSGTIRKEGTGFSLTVGRGASRVYESGFRTKAEAEARATLLRTEKIHRRLGVAADPRLVPALDDLAGPWLERRKATHAAGAEDGTRWRKHLAPWIAHLRPDEVDAAILRAFVEAKRRELAPGTIRVIVATLSSLYEDLLERGLATRNPARHLPKSLLRLVRSDHDPRTTPFLERLDDVRRVYLQLPEPLNVAFAVGALAGLRTGEVFALQWRSVDLASRRILVSESVKGQTKDRDPRPVPILDPLLPVLQAWRLRHPGPGLVVPPLRRDGRKVDKNTPGKALRSALQALGLAREGLGWYETTRHTFASQWAMAGRSLRELQAILGHSSIAITERYAHLVPGYFAPGVHGALQVDLQAGGKVASIARDRQETPIRAAPIKRNRKRKTGAAL